MPTPKNPTPAPKVPAPPYAGGMITIPGGKWITSGHARCGDCGEQTMQFQGEGQAIIFHRSGCPQGTPPRMPVRLRYSKMFRSEANNRELARLDISPESMTGRIFQSICEGMAGQAERIQELGYQLKRNIDSVNLSFEIQDPEVTRLNELGELQARATEYEASIGAFTALAHQRERFVQLAEAEQRAVADLAHPVRARAAERASERASEHDYPEQQ